MRSTANQAGADAEPLEQRSAEEYGQSRSNELSRNHPALAAPHQARAALLGGWLHGACGENGRRGTGRRAKRTSEDGPGREGGERQQVERELVDAREIGAVGVR